MSLTYGVPRISLRRNLSQIQHTLDELGQAL